MTIIRPLKKVFVPLLLTSFVIWNPIYAQIPTHGKLINENIRVRAKTEINKLLPVGINDPLADIAINHAFGLTNWKIAAWEKVIG